MGEILKRIGQIGLVPVVVDVLTEETAIALGKALIDGGIPIAEITFRTAGAETAIAHLRNHLPQLIVGAGTVLSVEQAELAIQNGAQFIVTPGLNAKVITYCQERNVDVLPGVSTPTEVETALGFGLDTVKFFPASLNGGVAAMKALNGPYKNIRFVPTGGIGMDDLAEYAAYDGIAAIGGTFMLGKHIAKNEWSAVTELCKQSVGKMLGLRIAHVGINTTNEEEAKTIAMTLSTLLRLPITKDGVSSIFVDTAIEVMKFPYLGANGHIGFQCNNVGRTKSYFESIGIAFNEESAKYKNEELTAIYFKDTVAGFALHLV